MPLAHANLKAILAVQKYRSEHGSIQACWLIKTSIPYYLHENILFVIHTSAAKSSIKIGHLPPCESQFTRAPDHGILWSHMYCSLNTTHLSPQVIYAWCCQGHFSACHTCPCETWLTWFRDRLTVEPRGRLSTAAAVPTSAAGRDPLKTNIPPPGLACRRVRTAWFCQMQSFKQTRVSRIQNNLLQSIWSRAIS